MEDGIGYNLRKVGFQAAVKRFKDGRAPRLEYQALALLEQLLSPYYLAVLEWQHFQLQSPKYEDVGLDKVEVLY